MLKASAISATLAAALIGCAGGQTPTNEPAPAPEAPAASPAEAPEHVGIGGHKFRTQPFDRYRPARCSIVTAVNLAHAALADQVCGQVEDFITPANQCRRRVSGLRWSRTFRLAILFLRALTEAACTNLLI